MDLNATFYGLFLLCFALLMGLSCYALGRRKTRRPWLAGLLGALLALIPVLSILFLLVLWWSPNLSPDTQLARSGQVNLG